MKYPLLALIGAVAITACNKPSVESLKPVIGHINMVDANDNAVPDNSAIIFTITYEGQAMDIPVRKDGSYELPLFRSTGLTTFSYSYPGYGTLKQFYQPSKLDSIQRGLQDLDYSFLLPISPVQVNSLTGTMINGVIKLNCNVTIPEGPGQKYICIYHLKDNPDISFNNLTNPISVMAPYPVTNGDNTITICTSCLKACAYYVAGDTMYIKAFGYTKSKFGYTSYFDPVENILVYPSVNKSSNSEVLRFVIP